MRIGILAASLFALALTFCIHAAQASFNEKECKSALSTNVIAACVQHELKDAKKELQEKLSDVRTILSGAAPDVPDLRKSFDASQRTWELYTYQTCHDVVWPFWRRGAVGVPNTLICELDLTRQRTRDLDRIFYVPLHD